MITPMENHADLRAKVLADWQEAIQDEEALLNDPEVYTAELLERALQAKSQGVINSEDLRELREWADSAQAWAVEELLSRELKSEQ